MTMSKSPLRLSLLPALLIAGSVQAQVCSTITTVGRYSVVCEGYLTPARNSPLVPAKQLGTVTSDDKGTFTASFGAMSLGGLMVTQSVTGTEKINKDCTGTITYTQTINGQPGPPLNITFIVSEQGNRIDGLVTDAGTVFSCVLRRLSNDEQPAVSAGAVKSSPRTTEPDKAESAVVARR